MKVNKFLSFLLILFSNTVFANIYDLQYEIDNTTKGKIRLPAGNLIIEKPIVIAKKIVIKGNNTVIINKTNDFAFKIVGKEGAATIITENILTVGKESSPQITVEDASNFKEGNVVKIIKENLPSRIDFNIIKAIDGKKITFLNRFNQGFSKQDHPRMIQFFPVKNVIIKDLVITGSITEAYGIYAVNSQNLRITNVTFKSIKHKSLHIEDSYFPQIINNRFIENGTPGKGDYGIGSVKNVGTIIANNKLFRSGAIYLKYNSFASVSNNESISTGATGGDGISIVSTYLSSFRSNFFKVPNCYGIWMKNFSEYNIISNNHFINSITSGIYLTDAANNLITNNFSNNNKGNGIFLDTSASENIVDNNITNKNSGWGIIVRGKNNIIKNNITQQNALANISIIPGNISKDNLEG